MLKKMPWGHFRKWPDPTHCSFRVQKSKLFWKILLLIEIPKVSCSFRATREIFPQVQLSRHSEASVALIQGGQAAAWAGSRPWHYPHGTGFSGMKNARVIYLWRLKGKPMLWFLSRCVLKVSCVQRWDFWKTIGLLRLIASLLLGGGVC